MTKYIRRRNLKYREPARSRLLEPLLEKSLSEYTQFQKVLSIQHLILSHPHSPSVSLDFINRLSPQRLRLDCFAGVFLSRHPHFFRVFPHPATNHPLCTLTRTALQLLSQEHQAIMASLPLAADRLVRLLSMSKTKALPLGAVSRLYWELGLPSDFKHSLLLNNPNRFAIQEEELRLVGNVGLAAAVEDWRVVRCATGDGDGDGDMRYSFSQRFPHGTSFKKDLIRTQEEWQRLAYVGPYDQMPLNAGVREREKRAVAVYHEFLSLTVEKMAEVEKMSLFSKCFGIDLDIMELLLNHPGIFYMSRNGDWPHTVFLKEAYQRGRLIEPNPVYEVRRKLLDLINVRERGMM